MIKWGPEYPTAGHIIRHAFTLCQKEWGGITFSWKTYRAILDGSDAYAVSIVTDHTETIAIPADSNYETFHSAFVNAMGAYGTDYLGVFRDDSKGLIEFDPVTIVETKAEVDELARKYPIAGGAYEFATGNGYWPNSRELTEAAL